MNATTNRRQFLKHSTLAGAGLVLSKFSVLGAESPNDRIVAAVMGLGRGAAHYQALQQIPNVEVAYLCDVDERRVASAVKAVSAKQQRSPKGVKDIRRVLEDKEVDVISIAAPNFWHAPATILSCAAGKHVYVEKPGSHNAREAEIMVAAARRYNRKVQLGTQRRSCPTLIEAIQRLHSGELGKVLYARTWYDNARASIGKGKPAPLPDWLDWDLWQGPCPERPYKDNLVHYNWHWHWHYGGGELANNGVHALDIARWGLKVSNPTVVTCNGGRYHFQDDQETPDTMYVTYHFGAQGINFENSSCLPRSQEKHAFVSFYAEKGVLSMGGGGDYKIYDPKGKEMAAVTGKFTDVAHFQNFIDAIRKNTPLNAEIEEGQKAAMLCHLGNIAYRTGQALHPDPETRRLSNAEAAKLWGREYRPGWEPKV